MARQGTERGLFSPRESLAAQRAGMGQLAAEGAVAPRPEERQGVPRRLVFRWLGWGTILALLGHWTVGTVLGFLWPRRFGAFGRVVSAGSVSDYQLGDVKVVRDGKFYVSRVPEGFIALWWKCPHLGCAVPWKPDEASMDPIKDTGRFNCPCHGSLYDRYGQVIAGPAPRPMDYFPLEIRDGKLLVATGPDKAVRRPRALHGPPHVTRV